jgi:hypothetical protein
MAKRPGKKPEKQLDLPSAPSPPPTIKVLPTQLQLGDRLVDERSEWRVAGRPYTSSGGKIVSVRVESIKQPGVTNVQVWGAHERVTVKRG